ncbi:aminotransferase class V-fold PLP-dependent enzyme [Caballeronia glebae]|jgi:selenocysteine lyase/cysteine desulfurase|uniref:aminotransferase class V-fold PLP-dependent enzyme n=1 Tax=Caballeronia glebae TaxID=1777143 RepID=UPI0038B86A27
MFVFEQDIGERAQFFARTDAQPQFVEAAFELACCTREHGVVGGPEEHLVRAIRKPVDVLRAKQLAAGTHKGLPVPQGLGVLHIADGLDELKPAYLAMSSMANPPADYVTRPDDMAVRKDALRFEFGNVNLPDVHALSAAIGLIQSVGVEALQKHVLALGDLLFEHQDVLRVSVVDPRARSRRNHIYVLQLPVERWADFFARNDERVSRRNTAASASRWRCSTPSAISNG